MSKSEQARADKPRALPSHIKLLDDRGDWKAGKILQADADLLSALDGEGVKYAEATDFERRLGGFVDYQL